jgi:DNA-binding MarR family transcriptional regulator
MPRSNTACDLTIRDNAGLACFHDITPAQAAVHMSSYPKGVGEVLMNPAPLKLAGRPWENEDDLLSHVGQLRSIARQLWRIAEGFTKSLENEAAASLDDAVPDRKKNDGDPAPDSEQLSRLARNAYKDRRRRDRLFGPDLFAEPAWDMLLDLFGQSIGRRNIRTRELLLASMVPATTALRWIGELEDSGLISRRPSLVDKRAHYVDLTDKGMDLMVRYFSQVAAGMTAMASGKDERDADFLEMASVSSSPERLPIALAGERMDGWLELRPERRKQRWCRATRGQCLQYRAIRWCNG